MEKSSDYRASTNRQAFYNILGPIILNGISFFTVPIFTRLLGTANYGLVAIYTTWVQISTIVLGLQVSGTIGTAKAHIEIEEMDQYASSVLFLSLCFFLVLFAVVLSVLAPIAELIGLDAPLIVLLLLNSWGSSVVSFTTVRYTYNKQANRNFYLSVFVALLSAGLSLLFIHQINEFDLRYIGRVLGGAIPNILCGLVFFIIFLRRGKVLFSKKYWGFCLPISLPLIFHGLSHVILGQSDRLMLQYYTDKDTVGIYSFLYTFTQILNVIYLALNNTWVPFYYDDLGKGYLDTIAARKKNYVFLFSLLTIGFVYLSPEIVKIFASPEFWKTIEIIPLLSLGSYFTFLYSFSVNFQLYHKKTINISIGTALAAIVNIILNFIFIPQYSIMGASIATTISYIALFIFHEIMARHIAGVDYHNRFSDYYKPIIGVTVSLLLFYLLRPWWIVRWLIGMGLAGLLMHRTLKNRAIF